MVKSIFYIFHRTNRRAGEAHLDVSKPHARLSSADEAGSPVELDSYFCVVQSATDVEKLLF